MKVFDNTAPMSPAQAVQHVQHMQKIVDYAITVCGGDQGAMIGAFVGAICVVGITTGALDVCLQIAIESLQTTQDMNRGITAIAPPSASKGSPS